MSTDETEAFRPISYSQHSESSHSPRRRPTVHFDDISALHCKIELAAPVKKSTIASNSSAARSAARETMPVTDEASQPTHPAPQACGNIELTAVDKTWGRLFELDGQPTKRLGEVMHSLARYIVCVTRLIARCVIAAYLNVLFSSFMRFPHQRASSLCLPSLHHSTTSMVSAAILSNINVSMSPANNLLFSNPNESSYLPVKGQRPKSPNCRAVPRPGLLLSSGSGWSRLSAPSTRAHA